MATLRAWPEPVIPVQSLAESGIHSIPHRYIKPLLDRQERPLSNHDQINIPVINLSHISNSDPILRREAMNLVDEACREWGFFQVVDHGVCHVLMNRALETWREFFELPMEAKQLLANTPATYEGYGSRLGVEKEAVLDWCDYYFLHYYPYSVRDVNKWPSSPSSCRTVLAEYGDALVELSKKLMRIFSTNLGLGDAYLMEAFGGGSSCLRANFYPRCPQPDLTLGLSPHTDPGGLTLLLADQHVAGLQVRKGEKWVSVKPLPNAFVVNLGDQIQILSNRQYRSVEHRAVVNSAQERISVAFFYNQKADIPIQPAKLLTTADRPPLYPPPPPPPPPSDLRRIQVFRQAKRDTWKSSNRILKVV